MLNGNTFELLYLLVNGDKVNALTFHKITFSHLSYILNVPESHSPHASDLPHSPNKTTQHILYILQEGSSSPVMRFQTKSIVHHMHRGRSLTLSQSCPTTRVLNNIDHKSIRILTHQKECTKKTTAAKSLSGLKYYNTTSIGLTLNEYSAYYQLCIYIDRWSIQYL